MDLSTMRGRLDALTATLLDLFSLVDSKYLLGGKITIAIMSVSHSRFLI